MAGKRASSKPESNRVFGQARKQAKTFRAGLYARVSTNDQQTIPLQMRALREYAARWGWTITPQVEEVGLWAARGDCADNYGGRPPSEYRCHRVLATEPLGTAADLFTTLQELEHLGIGFASLSEALNRLRAGHAQPALTPPV